MNACAGALPPMNALFVSTPTAPGALPLTSEIRGQAAGPAAGQPASPPASNLPGPYARSGAHPSAALHQLGQQFARALDEQGGAEDAPPPLETGLPAGPLPWPPAPPAPAAAPAPPSPSAASRAPAHAVAAAVKAQDIAPAMPTSVAQVEQGQVWELSLNEPDGVVLSLRAERVAAPASPGLPGSPAGDTPPAWSLVVNAPAAEVAALQRHAPRLAERLAARALAPAHVRIASRHDLQGD